MAPHPDEDDFLQFITQRKEDLRRISRATRGEHKLEDVIHEAWLMAYDLGVKADKFLDLANSDSQHKLLSHLFQHMVRYTDRKVRNAVRLDHAPAGSEDAGGAHPLSYLLASNNGQDVLGELVEKEDDLAREHRLASQGSLTAAYVYLLRHFDNRMAAVADHLLISRSYAYRCRAKARRLSNCETHIPIPIEENFLPGPWRSFQLHRRQVQLTLDFSGEWLC